MSKITELPFAGPLSGAEPVIVVQGGEARQSTIGAVVEEVAQPFVNAAQTSAGTAVASAAAADASFDGIAAALAVEGVGNGPAAYLKTLAPVSFPTVYRTDAGREGWYTWDATYNRQRALADPSEHIAFSPNTAVNGAWVRSNLSTKERQAINAAYRRVLEAWPSAEDRFDPAIERLPILGRQVNFNSTSEDLSDSHYAKDSTLGSEVMHWNGVKLQRLHTINFAGGIRDLRNADFDLENGALYIASMWVAAPRPVLDNQGLEAPNQFFWMQAHPNSSTYGHGAKLAFPTPRRVWAIIQGGATANTVKAISDPTVAWSGQAESAAELRWIFGGFGLGGSIVTPELWLGGLQIERAPDQTEKVGIVTLGTSIDVSGGGTGNGKDHWTQGRGWSRWLEGLLCAPIFPASIGGQDVAQIDARFNADVAPLREHSKYIVLCPNVNDFRAGFSSAAYRASWASIYAKALAAGWSADEIIWMTIQPRSVFDYANGAADLAAESAYIKATYRNVIDRAEIMRDAIDTGLLPPDFDTDGIHQNAQANRAIAFMIYNKYRHFFQFRNVPGLYQKTTNADNKVQSFGGPIYDTRKGAVRLDAASGAAAFRDNDQAAAPIVVFTGAAGSVKTFQLPCANFQRAAERVNTDIMRQQIVNLTTDSQSLSIQYYKRDGSDVLSAVGSAVTVPAGVSRTVCCDGDTVWVEDNPAIAVSAGWSTDTGTAKKTANATYTAGATLPFGATYSEAELDAMATRLAAVELALQNDTQRMKAVTDALIAAKILVA